MSTYFIAGAVMYAVPQVTPLDTVAPTEAAQLRPKRIVPIVSGKSSDFREGHSPGVAVLVGVGAYPEFTRLGTLKYPARDVDLLEKELSSQHYTVFALRDQDAYRDNILSNLKRAVQKPEAKSGVFIFFFSGHGFAVDQTNYLAAFDSRRSDLVKTGLPLNEVEALLKNGEVPRRVLLVDACRNDPSKGASESRGFVEFSASVGTSILYSTEPGAVSYEDDYLQQGIFSHFLLEGLHGAAASSDQLVSFGDLSRFVTNAVENYSRSKRTTQIPFESGEHRGDFLISVLRNTPVPGDPLPGEKRKHPNDDLFYVWVPPGSFFMGCSGGDSECWDDEKPEHRVQISRGFWFGQTPVTVGAWKTFVRRSGASMPPGQDRWGRKFNSLANNDSLPLVSVTWAEADEFCRDSGMRLPTEAEWEYAARAQSQAARYGDIEKVAWYGDNTGSRRLNTSILWREDQTEFNSRLFQNGNTVKPVAEKEHNAWSLFDILGNVFQWTSDWYGDEYYRHSEEIDPSGPAGGEFRVLRGGSWTSIPRLVRVSYRERYSPSSRYSNVGFRCAGNVLPSASVH